MMESLDFLDYLAYSFCGNTVREYLVAVYVLVLSILALKLFKYVLVGKIRSATRLTKTELDDLVIAFIDRIGWPIYLLFAFYVSLNFIEVPELIDQALYYALLVAVTFYAVKAIQNFLDYASKKYVEQRGKEERGKVDTGVIDFLRNLLKATLWFVAILLILSNMGYNISSLVAGLGIGGIAIAIALQNILEDIFASFSIYFDKPFKIGDFIVVGDDAGTVKKIGIKTTRLRSLQGQEIVISNRELTSTRVNNFKRMRKRRVLFTLGVLYDTPTGKMKKVPSMIGDIFTGIGDADLDRVHFKEFADSSLDFEVVYYVNSGDYNRYMDVQQEVCFAIKESFEREGIEFAYPTQTLYVNRVKN